MVTSHQPAELPHRASPLRSEQAYRFDFCGGHLALDFTNTVGDRGARPHEHFNTVGDIVAWAEARGVVSKRVGAALRHDAAADPDAARRAWRSAIAFREAAYHVLAAAASRRRAPRADLDLVNAHVRATFQRASLAP